MFVCMSVWLAVSSALGRAASKLGDGGRHRQKPPIDKAAADAQRLKTQMEVAYDLLQCGMYSEGLALLTQVGSPPRDVSHNVWAPSCLCHAGQCRCW